MESILSSIVPFSIILSFIGMGINAFRLEGIRKKTISNELPYTWGYFQGMFCMWIGCMWILTGLVIVFAGKPEFDKVSLGILIIGAVILYVASGYYIIQRKKWAWVTGTILTLNIFVWIGNYIYCKKRWHEFHKNVNPKEPSYTRESTIDNYDEDSTAQKKVQTDRVSNIPELELEKLAMSKYKEIDTESLGARKELSFQTTEEEKYIKEIKTTQKIKYDSPKNVILIILLIGVSLIFLFGV